MQFDSSYSGYLRCDIIVLYALKDTHCEFNVCASWVEFVTRRSYFLGGGLFFAEWVPLAGGNIDILKVGNLTRHWSGGYIEYLIRRRFWEIANTKMYFYWRRA